jgi:hypothetical protein
VDGTLGVMKYGVDGKPVMRRDGNACDVFDDDARVAELSGFPCDGMT